jgi:imidazoleglycerol-phosphate dehydratase
MADRASTVKRKTEETDIELTLNLDGSGRSEIETAVPFLDHMMVLLAQHGLFDLKIMATGDLKVDSHHTVEDVGICLGQAIKESLGEKLGIRRYGFSILPMDEALACVSLDISGRPYLVYDVDVPAETIGNFDTSLVIEFLRALVNNGGITLHVRMLSGRNAHHVLEVVFKGLAKALDMATSIDPRVEGVPSSKGEL